MGDLERAWAKRPRGLPFAIGRNLLPKVNICHAMIGDDMESMPYDPIISDASSSSTPCKTWSDITFGHKRKVLDALDIIAEARTFLEIIFKEKTPQLYDGVFDGTCPATAF